MKRLLELLKKLIKKEENPDKKQEALIRLGRREFKQLIEKGLSVPVMFL